MREVAAEGRLRVFAYAVADKAECYLRIVDYFAASRQRFRLQLRPVEVAAALGSGVTEDEVGVALEQLVVWGNLARLYD